MKSNQLRSISAEEVDENNFQLKVKFENSGYVVTMKRNMVPKEVIEGLYLLIDRIRLQEQYVEPSAMEGYEYEGPKNS